MAMGSKIGHNSTRVKSRHFIRAWRDQRGLTLQQLAERVAHAEGKDGMDHSQLSKIESGKTAIQEGRLYAIADSLNVEVNLLFVHPSVAVKRETVNKILDSKSDAQAAALVNAIKAFSEAI